MAEREGKHATGVKKARKPWTLKEFGGKTVWDWLHLLSALAIPVVLAVVGFWFTAQQEARQQAIEEQRAEAERELAEQRAQDEALQAYLDQMGTLLLEKDLRNSDEGSEVRTLARARTVTVLKRLDPSRKAAVMQFLLEAALVQIQIVEGRPPIIRLSGADMSGVDLSGADLEDTGLSSVDLSGADLSDADVSDASLHLADLSGTNLSGAELNGAELLDANLTNACLVRAVLSGATGITNKELEQQAKSLKGATMPDGQKYEDWRKSRGHGEDGESSCP